MIGIDFASPSDPDPDPLMAAAAVVVVGDASTVTAAVIVVAVGVVESIGRHFCSSEDRVPQKIAHVITRPENTVFSVLQCYWIFFFEASMSAMVARF